MASIFPIPLRRHGLNVLLASANDTHRRQIFQLWDGMTTEESAGVVHLITLQKPPQSPQACGYHNV